MNTTLIHTVKGKTIQLQYCTVHPRPYSRSHTICGTRGFAQKYPVATISLEDVCSGEADSVTTEELLQRYQHPFTATIGKEGARKGDEDKGYNPGYSFHGRMLALAQVEGMMAVVQDEINN